MPTPLELFGADLGLHLRAEDLQLANGAPVASWADSASGNALVAEQATSARRPIFVTAGAVGNKPAVQFDGVDDYLDIPSNVHTHVAQPTVFIVMKFVNNKTSWSNVFTIPHRTDLHTDPFARVGLAVFFDSNNAGRWDLRRDSSVFGDVADDKTAPYILAYQVRLGRFYENGTLDAGPFADGNATYPNVTPFRLAAHSTGGENASMQLYEIVVVKRDVTDNERAQINSHFQDKYGIAVSDYIAPADNDFGVSGLVFRTKASSIVLANNAPVASWPDTGGSSTPLVQATSASQPLFKTSVAELNGKPAVYFDGVDDSLKAVTAESSNPSTLFFVCVPRVKDVNSQPFFARKNSSGADFEIYNDSAIGAYITGTNLQFIVGTPHVLGAGAVYTLHGGNNPGGAALFSNGSLLGIDLDVSTGSASGDIHVGWNFGAQSRWFQGDVAEVIIFNRVLTDAERATIHTYIQNEYGIVVADYVPSGAEGSGRPKVNLGAGWVEKPSKVNLGAGWIEKPWKHFKNGLWRKLGTSGSGEIPPSGNPLISTLVSDFNTFDGFRTFNATNTYVSAGELVLVPTPSYDGYAEGSFTGSSKGVYDFVNQVAVVKQTARPAGASLECYWQISNTAAPADQFSIFTSGSITAARRRVDGVNLSQITNIPTDNIWWKVECVNEITALSTSVDGITWFERLSFETPAWMGAASFFLQAGNYDGGFTPPGPFKFDKFNILPSAVASGFGNNFGNDFGGPA